MERAHETSPQVGRRSAARVILAFLSVSAAVPGLWATLAPATFTSSFPLGAPGWVALSGGGSGHLVADVGAFYLAFAVLFGWAAVGADRVLVIPLCTAWSLFSVLHFGWHLGHLEPLALVDALAQMISLALVLVAPLTAGLLVRDRANAADA